MESEGPKNDEVNSGIPLSPRIVAAVPDPENSVSSNHSGDETNDRLSALPDSVLLHILSLLPMKDVVKTSALSKVWRFLWTSVPSLEFSFPYRRDFPEFLSESIERTLTQHHSHTLDGFKFRKFAIDIPYVEGLKSRVDSWLHFAVSRQVEELHLDFCFSLYILPCFVYEHSTLTKLSIHRCVIQPPAGGVHLPSLKNLSLYRAKLSDDAVTTILAGSCSLEFLELEGCSGLQNLKFSSSCLGEFTFGNHEKELATLMEVSVPNLLFLHLVGRWHNTQCRLTDVSSLVEVTFEIDPIDLENCYTTHDLLVRMKDLLQQLRNLETLTFLCYGSLKEMTRTTHFVNRDLWISLSDERTFSFLQLSLKRVEIFDFGPKKVGWGFIDLLVEFLLKNARVLEKMVFYIRDGDVHQYWEHVGSEESDHKILRPAAQRILSYKRASPAADVCFERCCE